MRSVRLIQPALSPSDSIERAIRWPLSSSPQPGHHGQVMYGRIAPAGFEIRYPARTVRTRRQRSVRRRSRFTPPTQLSPNRANRSSYYEFLIPAAILTGSKDLDPRPDKSATPSGQIGDPVRRPESPRTDKEEQGKKEHHLLHKRRLRRRRGIRAREVSLS